MHNTEKPQLRQDELTASPEFPENVLGIYEIDGMPRGFYNAGACKLADETTLLLGRYVTDEPRPGKPDVGPMAVAIVKEGKIESFQKVWKPESDDQGDQLEDPRIVLLPDQRLFIGTTRLAKYFSGYLSFPAVAFSDVESLTSGQFPETKPVLGLGTGDQTTPLGDGPTPLRVVSGKNTMPIDEHMAMFRRETDNHRFVVFSVNEYGEADRKQDLEIPKEEIPYWGQERMGLTMPPAWIDKGKREALLIVHGFQKVDGKLIYHIGSARLSLDENNDYAIDNISTEPLLSPGDFDGMFGGQPVERRPEERAALYLCGGTANYDEDGMLQGLEIFPSVGDTWTVGVTIDVQAIIRRWRASEAPGQVNNS